MDKERKTARLKVFGSCTKGHKTERERGRDREREREREK